MQRLAEFFKRIQADTYAEPPSPGHSRIIELMVPIVAKLLPAGASVLDVGAGQGAATERFKAADFHVLATTLNGEDQRELRRKGLDVCFTDQNDMPESWSGCWDCVWARHVLEHSIMPYFTLHEFNRVLRPKGILYVEVPAPDTDCAHESNKNHYSVLGKRAWICLIHRAGFEIEEARELKFETPAGPDVYWSFICRKR